MRRNRRHHRLSRRLREKRAGGEHAGQRSKPVLCLSGIDDLVDQADPQRFLCVYQLAGEQQALGRRRAEQVRRPLQRSRRIDDAELGRGDPEPGVGRGDAEIAVDGERTPAADAVAGDERDCSVSGVPPTRFRRRRSPPQTIVPRRHDTLSSVMSAPAQKCAVTPRNTTTTRTLGIGVEFQTPRSPDCPHPNSSSRSACLGG